MTFRRKALAGCIILIILGVLVSNDSHAQLQSGFQYELDTPEWYIPSSGGFYELPNGDVAFIYWRGTQIYDGGKWNTIQDLIGVSILSIETFKEEVWVGLDYDFGKLVSEGRGEWKYQSMKHILPDSVQIQDQIIGLYSTGKELFISTFKDNYIWDGETIQIYSARQILDEVLTKTGEQDTYERLLLNMTHVVDNQFIQDLDPYGYVMYKDGTFIKDTTVTKGLPGIVFGIVDIGDGDFMAPTFDGVYKYSAGEWREFEVEIPESDSSRFYGDVSVLDESRYVFFSEEYVYIVNKAGEIEYSSQQIGGLTHEESFNLGGVTENGTIWQVGDQGILRIYPNVPARQIWFPAYTYSDGQIFTWQSNELLISRFSGGGVRFAEQDTPEGVSLDERFSSKEGIGSVIGVYNNQERVYFPHEYQLLEYEGDSLISESNYQDPVSSFFSFESLTDTFFVGMRGGLGILKKQEDNEWRQELIFEDGDFSRIKNIISTGNDTYTGGTGNGVIFQINVSGSKPVVTRLINLRDKFGIQQINSMEIIDSQLAVFTNKGTFTSDKTFKEWRTDHRFDQIPANVTIAGIAKHENTYYLNGADSWSAQIWQYKNQELRVVPLNSRHTIHGIEISPSGNLWASRSPTLTRVNPEEAIEWYDSQNVELFVWADIDSTGIQNRDNEITLPNNYSELTLNAGFGSSFFPNYNRYRARVNEGIWGGWQSSSQFNFSYLLTGQYAVEIQGVNGLGQVHTADLFSVDIKPPWYLSTLALNMYVLGALLLIGFIVRGYGQYRARQQEALDRIKSDEREKVRKKLATDFHDELGNRITRIGLHIKILQQGKQDKMDGILSKMESNTNSLYTETRHFIWQMDPRKDSLHDTYGWLKTFGDEFFEHSRIDFIAKPIQPEARQVTLDMETRTNIVRIFKEAMNNAQKYSEAKTCSLSINRDGAKATIEFKDNGKGMDLDAALTKGNGLNNMIDRSKESGGELSIISKPGEGTSIRYSFIWNTEKMKNR